MYIRRLYKTFNLRPVFKAWMREILKLKEERNCGSRVKAVSKRNEFPSINMHLKHSQYYKKKQKKINESKNIKNKEPFSNAGCLKY